MTYEGQTIQLNVDDGIATLVFDNRNESVNKFDRLTLEELRAAVDALKETNGVRGLIMKSGKSVFIVGADITEFGDAFAGSTEDLIGWLADANAIFNDIEDLPYPSVCAINGTALGGGFEAALSTDYRVMSASAAVGLPEIKLGIIPGFGGTVRLPRLIGADNAIEVIAAGKTMKPAEALKTIVDAVVAPEKLETLRGQFWTGPSRVILD